MNNKIDERIEMLKNNQLSEDDYFEFGCIQCGECCRNRYDILLNPYDLYKIAKYLNMRIIDVIDKYCEIYIGSDSKMPVVRARPKIYNAVCSFLRNGKCSIHSAKPTVCALYPLGRAASPDGGMIYFTQGGSCNANSTPIKVKDWIEMFNLKESELPAKLWSQTLVKLSLSKRKFKIKPQIEEQLNNELVNILYLSYDTTQDFLPQFKNNSEKAEKCFAQLTGKSLSKVMKGVEVNEFLNTCRT